MASVIKRAKSSFWVACYRGRDGKRMQSSTKTTDQGIALRMALELEGAEKLATEGKASAAQFQKIVNKITQEVIGDKLPSPSVTEYLTGWIAGIKHKNAPATIERYNNSVRLFLASLGPTAAQPIRSLTPLHIETFLNQRLEGGSAPKTAIVDVKALSCALRRAENYGVIDKSPAPAVQVPKNVSSEHGIFTPEEVHRVLEAAPNQDWQTLILFGYYLGARLGDCVSLTWEHIDLERGMIVYEQKKTGKRVAVPMAHILIKHLLNLADSHNTGFLCPSIANKTPGGKHGLSESFVRIVRRAGIDPQVSKGKGSRNFTKRIFHSLRHSFNSVLANAGIAEEVRMRLTGHSSREVHARCTHINEEPLRHAIAKLPMINTPKPR